MFAPSFGALTFSHCTLSLPRPRSLTGCGGCGGCCARLEQWEAGREGRDHGRGEAQPVAASLGALAVQRHCPQLPVSREWHQRERQGASSSLSLSAARSGSTLCLSLSGTVAGSAAAASAAGSPKGQAAGGCTACTAARHQTAPPTRPHGRSHARGES